MPDGFQNEINKKKGSNLLAGMYMRVCVCVCVCMYIHTHTHTLKLNGELIAAINILKLYFQMTSITTSAFSHLMWQRTLRVAASH